MHGLEQLGLNKHSVWGREELQKSKQGHYSPLNTNEQAEAASNQYGHWPRLA